MNMVTALTEAGVIKHGDFTLKSGQKSSIYIDLRQIIAYPKLLTGVANDLWEKIKHLEPSLLCGVPYTALPIATVISTQHDIPMLIRRREAKDYGTKKMIEGLYQQGENCVIIEDVITTGSSVIETIDLLNEHGIKVTDVAVYVDREQGGQEAIEAKGCNVYSVLKLSELKRD